jgi:hypothetical protein
MVTRASDTKLTLDEAAAIQSRMIQSWAGLVIAIGGSVLSIVRPEYAYYGMAVALVGAGVLDAKALFTSFIKK